MQLKQLVTIEVRLRYTYTYGVSYKESGVIPD